MSGRGDNNKNGSSGAGASNQSGQAIPKEQGKMNHGKQTGGQPSEPMRQERDQDSNRNTSTQPDRS
ncbi:hypothetical protein [Flaviaesturariibacter amylovorans]|uniref:Uncharacterized protein n=1 Tax=Flaviaesturariibacter amylovorans TaxID=1084520 RepID=A0ABP8GTJ9_9BACT